MADPCLCGYWKNEHLPKGTGKSYWFSSTSTEHGCHYWRKQDGPCRPPKEQVTRRDNLKQIERLKKIEEMALSATDQLERHVYLITSEFLREETGCSYCQETLLKLAMADKKGNEFINAELREEQA